MGAKIGFVLFSVFVAALLCAGNPAMAQTPIDLGTWAAESYPAVSGFPPGNWTVAPDGESVFQSNNGQPTFFYSDFDAYFSKFEGRMRVTLGQWDNDYIGFALGFHPGDSGNPGADYLLIDWKKQDQPYTFGSPSCTPGSFSPGGLAVSRVFGIPTADEFWGHTNFDAACSDLNNGLQELARGINLGSTGWNDGQEYVFTFEFTPTSLKVYVDGTLELDINGSFNNGRFAFYNFSQEQVNYRGFKMVSLIGLDIKPRSCPNPFNYKIFLDMPANAKSKKGGVLPVAIVGSEDIDVMDVDAETVLLEGIAPLRWSYEDVTTPFIGDECDCHTEGPDGIMDLTFKFLSRDVAAALPPVADGDVVPLTITGQLVDGTPFEVSDCIIIRSRDQVPEPLLVEPGVVLNVRPNPFNPVTQITYVLPDNMAVKLSVYDISGRLISHLADGRKSAGEHTVMWDGSGVASGVYFCRLEAGGEIYTTRLILLK